MSRYGISKYGTSYYGPDNAVNYVANNFVASPTGYGELTISWTTPTGSWSKIMLVRNPYGFPVNISDGIVIKLGSTTDFAYFDGAPSIVKDSNLEQEAFFYYSLFVFETVQFTWIKVGEAIGVSVKDYNQADNMYDYLPAIYKITQPYSATSEGWDNDQLYRFLSIFGFELDYLKTLTTLLNYRYDTKKTSALLIPTMLYQFGIPYDDSLGVQRNRALLASAPSIQKQKGSYRGLIDYLKAYTGYGVPENVGSASFNGVQPGGNLFLDNDSSSFEQSIGTWTSTTANLSNPTVREVRYVSITSNVATVTFDIAHNYVVGNVVTITGTPFPVFNSTFTITAVGTNTISFALTQSDLVKTYAYNYATNAFGIATPSPAPWSQVINTLYYNEQKGILSVVNNSTSSQDLVLYCGADDPIQKGIPVKQNISYSFAVYTAKSTTARNVKCSIVWYDRFGAIISTSDGTGIGIVSNNTTSFSASYHPFVTDTAPSGAYYAVPKITIASSAGSASNEIHYFDCANFGTGLYSYEDARNLHITLRANRINELYNPNFTFFLTGQNWTTTGGTNNWALTSILAPNVEVFSTVDATIASGVATLTLNHYHSYAVGDYVYVSNVAGTGITGSNYNGAQTITARTATSISFATAGADQATAATTAGTVWEVGDTLQVTSTGTSCELDSSKVHIYYPNTSYTFSAYVQDASAAQTNQLVTAKIFWYNGANVLINGSTAIGTPVTTSDNTVWYRVSVTGTAPSQAEYAIGALTWNATAVGKKLNIDQALFENNPYVLDYFDGNGGAEPPSSYLWQGTAGKSRSHFYSNFYNTEKRLLLEGIDPYVMRGTNYIFYFGYQYT